MPTKINSSRQAVYQFDENRTEAQNAILKGQKHGTATSAGGGIAIATRGLAQGGLTGLESDQQVWRSQENQRDVDLSGVSDAYLFPRRRPR